MRSLAVALTQPGHKVVTICISPLAMSTHRSRSNTQPGLFMLFIIRGLGSRPWSNGSEYIISSCRLVTTRQSIGWQSKNVEEHVQNETNSKMLTYPHHFLVVLTHTHHKKSKAFPIMSHYILSKISTMVSFIYPDTLGPGPTFVGMHPGVQERHSPLVRQLVPHLGICQQLFDRAKVPVLEKTMGKP